MHHIHIAEAERSDVHQVKLMQAAEEMLRAVASANAAWTAGRRRRRSRRSALAGAAVRRALGRRGR